METMHDIFISYSRRNLAAVKAIKEELEAEGFSCWMDLSGIPSGQGMFISTIVPAIRETKAAFLFFLTAESQASEWAMKEIGFAKGRARKNIVLVRINDDEMTDDFYFNYQLTDIIDWRVPEQKEKLLGDIRRWAGKEEKPAKTAEEKKADGDGGATKAPQPEPETLLHIDSDEDCTVWLSDKVVARRFVKITQMKAGEDRVLRLRKGKHKLAFVSMVNSDVRIEQVYEVAEGGTVDIIKVKLSEQRRQQEEAERMRRQKEKAEREEARRISGKRRRPLQRNLVIGCGGAGIAAMEELHRMLALDAGTLREASEKVFYLAVDTDSSALERFRATLEEIAEREGVPAPICQTVHLSKGVATFREAVEGTALADGRGDPGRLRDHWWFDGEGHPFEAPRVRDLVHGTGMCPAVAYGLAWRGMEHIGEALDRIVREALLRGGGEADPLDGLDIFVTAGLAGGTGRGCWQLVASKVREHLEEKHCRVSLPTGVFFGADVYADLTRAMGRAGTPLVVNTLTGVSELSGWMVVNAYPWRECDAWRLPSPGNPAAPDADVLNLDRLEHPAHGPVGRAYLICGRSRQAALPTSLAYHQMAGKALYAMISLPSLAARSVNDPEEYKSLAAATFSVDRPHIEAYCKALAREMALDRMTEKAGGGMAAAVEAFLAKCPLDARVRNKDDLFPDPKGSLYQRASWALLMRPECQAAFEEISSNLKWWTLNKAKESIRRLMAALMDPDAAREAVRAALDGLGIHDPGEALAEAVKSVAGEDPESLPSAQRALEFLKALRAKIDEGREAPSPEWDVNGIVREALEAYSKRKIRFIWGTPAFRTEDCRFLCHEVEGGRHWGLVPWAVAALNCPEMEAAIEEAFEGALLRIRKLVAGLEAFRTVAPKVRMDIAREGGGTAGERIGDDGFSMLFATPERIEETLYPRDNAMRLYHRVLKPVVESREEVKRTVADAIVVGRSLKVWFDRLLSGEALDPSRERLGEEAENRLADELRELLRGAVGLRAYFMEERFSFRAVLEKNRLHWNHALEEAWKDSDFRRLETLTESFRATLGVEWKDSCSRNAPPQLPPAEELLAAIAASMGATCVPWWMVDPEARCAPSAVVFVPFDTDSRTAERVYGAFGPMGMPHVQICGLGEDGEGTPFACVAYAEEGLDYGVGDEYSHPLDHVRSLDDWKNPKVRRWLQLAEREDGASIFSEEDGNPGLGYVSPWFVRDRAMSSHRWKPWAEKVPE